jgi:hypothetical protein
MVGVVIFDILVNGYTYCYNETNTNMDNYIGVNFYDNLTPHALPCHPTWEVTYLETFNRNPPILRQSKSKLRYQTYLRSECSETFSEWIKYGMYKPYERKGM